MGTTVSQQHPSALPTGQRSPAQERGMLWDCGSSQSTVDMEEAATGHVSEQVSMVSNGNSAPWGSCMQLA